MSYQDPIIERFNSFTRAIHDAETFDQVVKVCREIDNMDLRLFGKHAKNETTHLLSPAATNLTHCLIKYFKLSKDMSFHLKVLKAILKPALCYSYMYVERLFEDYASETNEVGSECLRINTWFQNFNYIIIADVFLPNNLEINETFIKTSLKYSADTRYFAVAIENNILSYDTSPTPTNEPNDFNIVITNLENSHQNVHKQLLELFRRMVKAYDKNRPSDVGMLNVIMNLSWTNRNKYALLGIIISIDQDLLVNHPKFNMTAFINGLQIGLTIHNLLSASQFLVKAIQGKDTFCEPFIKIVAQVMWEGDDLIVGNIIKYWFSTFELPVVEKVYGIMNADGKFNNLSTTSDKFYRLLVLRNTFKRTFKNPELDQRIKDFACDFDEISMKIEIFNVLIEIVHAEVNQQKRYENILTLLNFLRCNVAIEDSSFIEQHVMRKLPDVFNLLASKRFRNVQVLREFFKIIRRDLYQQGINLGTYESIFFSVRLLKVILKQYCGSSGSLLSKNTNIEENLKFGKYLKNQNIWDGASEEVFNNLLKLVREDQHSDLCEFAVSILIEFFIKTPLFGNILVKEQPFCVYLTNSVALRTRDSTVSTSSIDKLIFAMMYEGTVAGSLDFKSLFFHDSVEWLDEHFEEHRSLNPVDQLSLPDGTARLSFKLMDNLNYELARLRLGHDELNLLPSLSFVIKKIACHFIYFFCDLSAAPSFEHLDKRLTKIISESKVKNAIDQKPKLILFIWYTLRSCAELSATLATVVNKNTKPTDEVFKKVMTNCLELNIEILTKCCHKGVIDSASEAIGKIAKIISKEYTKRCTKPVELHALLVTMKKQIFANQRPSSKTGDVRSSRGLLVMAHEIISSHPPFLKFLMENLLVIKPITSFADTQSIRFHPKVLPIQLHLLAALIKDSELVEEMLKYLDFILISTFKAYKESKDFVMVNALLQLIGAIVPKIANQKRSILTDDEDSTSRYEPKTVSVYEFYVKFTYAFRIALLDLSMNMKSLSTTYIIILLEIFSNFEYRNNVEHWSEIESLRQIFHNLMDHECEKIRVLAGRCFAQWHNIDNEMLNVIKKEINKVFSSDTNLVHSMSYGVRYMIERYESCVMFVTDFNAADFKASLRTAMLQKFEQVGFPGANNFYVRCHLLDFLLFIGFPFNHKICQSLTAETNLSNTFGYKLWCEKIRELRLK